MQEPNKSTEDTEFLTTQEVAKLLNVKPRWVSHNRTEKNPIPYKRFGRLVRYQMKDVTSWIRKCTKT